MLYQDGDRLVNFWVNEHDVANPAGCTPILVMDVFEHAFMVDYGLKRADIKRYGATVQAAGLPKQ